MDTSSLTTTSTAVAEPPGSIATILQQLKDAIWKRRPILGEIMHRHGNKMLYDYAKDFLDVNKSPLLDKSKEELVDVVQTLVAERLGEAPARSIADQLHKLPLVSTTDHHSSIDHPFWVNANLISAIPYIERKDPLLHTLVVLSFSSVSLNNASGYPRGIQFYGGMNGSKNVQRLPILPDSLKMGVVYATRAFDEADVRRAKNELYRRVREGIVTSERAEGIENIINEYFATNDVLSASSLNAQITKINYRLWPTFFHPAKGEQATGVKVPNLLYLEIETLVSELLVRRHLTDKTSLMYRVLFDPTLRTLVQRHFNGIPEPSRSRETGARTSSGTSTTSSTACGCICKATSWFPSWAATRSRSHQKESPKH